jgi:hypothetical protein
MLCDYLELNKTEMTLYVAGAEGMQYCLKHYPEIADIYIKDFEWVFPKLDEINFPKSELRKIFVESKKYTDKMQFEEFLKFFISQHCGIIRMVGEEENFNYRLLKFESFGNSINKEIDTSLVFESRG